MIAAGRLRIGPFPAIVALIAGAWILAIVAEWSGRARALHHDALTEGGLPLAAALGLFLLVWQVHVAAMMLPSSLPLVGLFGRAAAGQPHPHWVTAAFLSGYAVVWTGFAALAFAGDVALHLAVGQLAWLEQRPWLIGGGVLLLAGAFQFSGLKERCLRECRSPRAYLAGRYRRGPAAAFRLGTGHGLFCLGCCWALMLVMFAAGVVNVAWMAPLALVMVFEKTAGGGERAVAPIGVAFLALGVLTVVDPAWFPTPFAAR